MKRAVAFGFLLSLAIVAGCGGGGGGGSVGGPPPTTSTPHSTATPTATPSSTSSPTVPSSTVTRSTTQQALQVLQIGQMLSSGVGSGNYNQLLKSQLVRGAMALHNQGVTGRHRFDSNPTVPPPPGNCDGTGVEFTSQVIGNTNWIYIWTYYDLNCTTLYMFDEIGESYLGSTATQSTSQFQITQSIYTPVGTEISYNTSTGYITINLPQSPDSSATLALLEQQTSVATGPAANTLAEIGANCGYDGNGNVTSCAFGSIANSQGSNSSFGLLTNFTTYDVAPVAQGIEYIVQGSILPSTGTLGALSMNTPLDPTQQSVSGFPNVTGGVAGNTTQLTENMTFTAQGLPVAGGTETLTDQGDNVVVQIQVGTNAQNNPVFNGTLYYYTPANVSFATFSVDTNGNGTMTVLSTNTTYTITDWAIVS